MAIARQVEPFPWTVKRVRRAPPGGVSAPLRRDPVVTPPGRGGNVPGIAYPSQRGSRPLVHDALLGLQHALGNRTVQRQIARSTPGRMRSDVPVLRRGPAAASHKEITAAQTAAAVAWAQKAKLGKEAIAALQATLAVTPVTGVYDEATAAAVYVRQQELKIGADGMAGPTTFARLGLVLTHEIAAAGVGDEQLAEVQKRFPTGVTVAIYPLYKNQSSNNREFQRQADPYAKAEGAIGLDGGAITIGQKAVTITELGDVVETVQGIHRGLVAKYQQTQAQSGSPAAAPDKLPAFTKVRNLSLFSHGMGYGMALDAAGRFRGGGLMAEQSGLYPANIASFVKGIADAVTPDVHVQLFACNTGHDTKLSDYEEWTRHKQGERRGAKSFAAALAAQLGPEASVYGHTTAGHTTENFAALVFGKDAGGGEGGLHMFDRLYPEDFVQAELARLFPEQDEAGRASLHDSLRDQMWEHYKDSISAEAHRGAKSKRYGVQIGKEMFINPDNAAALLHEDWKTHWIPSRLGKIKPKKSAA
ncbi:MAG TPA: peptidoglycan-binding domain-containing protein [Thermomicrobiales bacterium]